MHGALAMKRNGLFVATLTVMLVACASVGGARPAGPHTVYLVNHGWHTGIVLAWSDEVARVWPQGLHAAGRQYVEVGWGERDFYPAPGFSVRLAAKALFWRNESVLHLVAFDEPVAQYFAAADWVALGLDADGYARLIGALGESFARDGAGGAVALGPGLYGDSRFYLARERYHLFNTCNVWTAHKLKTAGVPVAPWRAVTAGQLMRQARAAADEK